ncbi:MAG: MFS transporter, partial [Candidatus Limnocylindria bacterium]
PRMIALISSAWIVPGLVGPALAGWVAEVIGWRWVFLGIVGPVLIMGLAVYPQLARLGPATRSSVSVRSDTRRAFDALRLALGSTLVLASLTVGGMGVPVLELEIPRFFVALALAAAGGTLALTAVRHLVPAGTLTLKRGRPSTFAGIFAIAFAFFGTEAFVPLTVVEVRGGSVILGGLALSAAAVTWSTGSWLQARAAGAGTRRTLVVIGASLIGTGIALTALVLLPALPVLVAAVGWTVAGLGMGLAFSMLSLLVLETAARGEEGFSSAGLQLMFTLGTAFGAGAGGAIVAVADSGALTLAEAIGVIDGVMFAVAMFAVLVAVRVPRRPPERAAALMAAGEAVPVSGGALPVR